MKWTLDKEKKLRNYKGEEFPGKVSKDFEPGDQYEELDERGKKLLMSVNDKKVREDGSVIIFVTGSEVNQ